MAFSHALKAKDSCNYCTMPAAAMVASKPLIPTQDFWLGILRKPSESGFGGFSVISRRHSQEGIADVHTFVDLMEMSMRMALFSAYTSGLGGAKISVAVGDREAHLRSTVLPRRLNSDGSKVSVAYENAVEMLSSFPAQGGQLSQPCNINALCTKRRDSFCDGSVSYGDQVIMEQEGVAAIVNKFPESSIHLLVITVEHQRWELMPDDLARSMYKVAYGFVPKALSMAVASSKAPKTGTIVLNIGTSQTEDHPHIHLIAGVPSHGRNVGDHELVAYKSADGLSGLQMREAVASLKRA